MNLFCVGIVTVYTQARQLRKPEFPSGTSVQYLAIGCVFSVDEPIDCFFAVIDIACVSTSEDQSDSVDLQKLSSEEFIACRCYCRGFLEHFDISNLEEFPPEDLARLAQHGDVILTVIFQYAPFIKCLRHLRLVPLKIFSLSDSFILSVT
jgi:hypothetical protein